MPKQDRLAYFREIIGRGAAGMDIEPLSDEPFYTSSVLTLLPGLGLISGESSSRITKRTRELIAADGKDTLNLLIPLAGVGIGTGYNREAVITPGDAILMSSAEPCNVTWPNATKTLSVFLPRLRSIVPGIDDQIIKCIPRDTPALLLLTNYLDAWQYGALATTPQMQQMLSDHLYDLVALIFNAKGDNAEIAAQRGGRDAWRVAIRREIARSFTEPDFSLPELARRIGVTPRYVQLLLAEDDSSFVNEVTAHRLKRAHELLQSQHHQHLSITAIAFACGFSTDTHFYRQFRRYYGMTPGDVRALK
ncbi:MAG: helix-turn-helix domain-containing protein [Chromatiales bacterium]|nr:helix-turn-helix domain-containing protein [Chromatiales bacterium]